MMTSFTSSPILSPTEQSDFAPGVYPGISAETYHAIEAASSHRLGDLSRSPAHCRWNIEHPKEQTPAMLIGEACHCCILTPELFAASYMVSEPCHATLESGERKGETCGNSAKYWDGRRWFCKNHAKKYVAPLAEGKILTTDQYAEVTDSSAEVLRDPTISDMLAKTPAEDRELTIIWIDKRTGQKCKARLDALCRSARIIFDFKSSLSAERGPWIRQAKTLGYHRQAAFYLEACKHIDGESPDLFYAIPFEKKPPHGLAIAKFSPEILEIGRRENRHWLAKYAECSRTGIWPGYPSEPFDVPLDQWQEARVLEMEES